MDDIRLPETLRLGSATAGHQIEGDNCACQEWHQEIHDPRRAAQGRVPSGRACDHWNRYRADVDLIAGLGHQAYRYSIEWSRIEPEEGRRDDAAYAHYRDLTERLAARGIQPWISVCHYTHPQWFEEKGGCVGDDDRERCRYIALHLAAVHEAFRLGVDVRVYCYWSLMDNFEWGSFVPRFGLVEVDYRTFRRAPKPSAWFYRDLIRNRNLASLTTREGSEMIP
jgi:beta-glucosidase